MMTQLEAVLKIVSLCEQQDVDYMIVGSFSSNFYSIPRATKDADIVIQVTSQQKNSIIENLPIGMVIEPQISFEIATNTMKTVIYVSSIAFEIELFDLSEDIFDKSRFQRRTKVDFNGHAIYLPTAEDVIIQKLRWYHNARREKDLEDATNVYLLQKDYLDIDYIEQWIKLHNSQEIFASLIMNN